MRKAVRLHAPEYLCEAACLGSFMISAGLITALLEYPNSPVRHAIPDDFVRLALNGLAMGLTVIGGMLLAVEIYRMLKKGTQVACAKWNHDPRQRCIFCGHLGKLDD